MHLVRKKPRRLEPLLEMCKKQTLWQKLVNLIYETTIAEESGRTYSQESECGYNTYPILGIRKDGKALNTGHALMQMPTWKYIIIAHTKASIDGIPPKK